MAFISVKNKHGEVQSVTFDMDSSTFEDTVSLVKKILRNDEFLVVPDHDGLQFIGPTLLKNSHVYLADLSLTDGDE